MADDQKTLDAHVAVLEERIIRLTELCVERFDQSEKAVATALVTQEKAVAAAFDANEKATAAAFAAAKEAVIKAENAQARVNEGQNEFRGALKDTINTFMPRAEAELRFEEHRKVSDRIATSLTAVTNTLAASGGKSSGINSVGGWIFGGLMLIATIIMAIANAISAVHGAK